LPQAPKLGFRSQCSYDPRNEVNTLKTTVELESYKGSVRLNVWDFGGQEIYHGSHTLFLHSQAIFLLLWNPEEEKTCGKKTDSDHRPITYWLDYLRSVAGTDNPLIVVQSQCDTPEIRAEVPVRFSDWIGSSWTVEVSAKSDYGLERLKATLKDAAWACLHKRRPPPIGVGRLKVRDRLRQMLKENQERESAQRQQRLLERTKFDRLCDDIGGISDKEALLDFLHHNGVVFFRPGLFQNQIILDQNWALEAIYSIFHRDKCLKQLKKLHGRFSREDLELLIWSGYTPAEQNAFLGMMESRGICFKVWQYPIENGNISRQSYFRGGPRPRNRHSQDGCPRVSRPWKPRPVTPFSAKASCAATFQRSVSRLAMWPFTGNMVAGLTKKPPTAAC
jgi:internalin A